uniref:Cytochrome P450 n=2 Tax=Ascaris TaxID=6251 RepID=A0A0M3HV14_ASCLU
MAHLWITVLGALIAILYNILRYIRNHREYWKQRKVAGPEPSFWCGNLKELVRPEYPAPLQLRDWTKQYGKVYGIQEGWESVLVVSDVDVMQDLFVRKFEQFYGRKNFPFVGDVDKEKDVHVFSARGLRWKRLRTLSNPTFSVNSLKKMKSTVEDSVLVMLGYLEEHADVEKSFNIHPYYQQLTMDVIARVAMGQKGSQQFRSEYLDLVKAIFGRPADQPFAIAIKVLPPIFTTVVRKLATLTAKMRGMPFIFLKEQIEDAVNERRKLRSENGGKHEAADFIDLFLDAEAEVDLTPTGYDKNNLKVEKKLSPSEVVMQCFVFLLAGFDTTANSLAYASYCIAKNPHARRRVQEEIDAICAHSEVSYEQIQQLRYLDMVVKEALRLYPLAAFASSRTCMEATKLGDVEVEKGISVLADVFSVHYDKRIWGEDADEFRPERWEGIQRHPLSWLPFGAGPRMCIGKRLAEMEEKLALVHILRKYDIIAAPDTEVWLFLKM